MKHQLGLGRLCAGFALGALVVTATITARAQTPLQAQLSVRPVTNDDIAANKLPSTVQKSGGLTTVGLGQPAYLEARVNIAIPESDIGGVTWSIASKPAASKANFETSPLGMTVPIYEPSDRLASRVVGRTMLRPDVPGRYVVVASISYGPAGTTDVRLEITGATYLGINGCSRCHSGGPANTPWSMADSWKKTGHAVWFQKGLDGELEGGTYGSGCISCHTVGYDANAKISNGSF